MDTVFNNCDRHINYNVVQIHFRKLYLFTSLNCTVQNVTNFHNTSYMYICSSFKIQHSLTTLSMTFKSNFKTVIQHLNNTVRKYHTLKIGVNSNIKVQTESSNNISSKDFILWDFFKYHLYLYYIIQLLLKLSFNRIKLPMVAGMTIKMASYT